MYVPTGRGHASLQRAQEADLEAAGPLESALAASDFVLSVRPPHAAEDVAHEVLTHPFRGAHVEVNASARTRRIAAAYAERDVLMLVPQPPAYRGDQYPTTARKDQ
ncbi:hypothetical protein [Streptomyces sp. NRRL F-525]|uniref:hypothetical protein n=1 Tax=Streptomyces sp. NRRL F-525 TaxID=1463861 RepID=UPI000691835C|nr:hypothetical protein [Streptomyces sp. NRRL F-525]